MGHVEKLGVMSGVPVLLDNAVPVPVPVPDKSVPLVRCETDVSAEGAVIPCDTKSPELLVKQGQ